MKKRVFIIHGWGDKPEGSWFFWMRDKLKEKGAAVEVPAMPNTEAPSIEEWIGHLKKVVGTPDGNTYFVAHSIGCQAVMRYLETLSENVKFGGMVFVGSWLTLKSLGEEEAEEIAKPWLETPIDFEKVKSHVDNITAIFSDNDQYVPIENKEEFEKKLGAKTILEHDKGHMAGEDKIMELPSALKAITAMVQK